MFPRIAFAWLVLAPLLQAQVVGKVNGPLAGNVSRFAWTPDDGYVLYDGNVPEIVIALV